MKPISEIKSALKPRILLLGAPFSGKTTLAAHFPKVAYIDLDGKFANALKTIPNPDGWLLQPLQGVESELTAWSEIDKAVTTAAMKPEAKTVVLDSLTQVDHWLRRYVANVKPTNINPVTVAGMMFMSQAHWNPYEVLLRKLLGKLFACDKVVIVIAHVEVVRDEFVGGLWQQVLLPGKSQSTIPALFTDCWHVRGEVRDGRWRTIVRTVPGGSPPLACCGSSLRLPPEFDFSWPVIEEALK